MNYSHELIIGKTFGYIDRNSGHKQEARDT